MRKKEYPYQNLSLAKIKGEKWKDIPGLEDEYQLSNYGRVKSLDRYVDYGQYECLRIGRIIKLRLSGAAKKKTRQDLQMKLHKDGKRYQFSVARWVYYLFVADFDTGDYSVIVTRKDGDILNCHYKNLLLRSISDVAKEGYATHRRTSRFQLQSKQVTQYDANGEKIASFKNAKFAGEATGLPSNYINDAARIMKRMSGGFYWRYGKPRLRIRVSKLKRSIELPASSRPDPPNHHYLNRSIKGISGEKWKEVKGFEGLYAISDHGRVKTLRRLRRVSLLKGRSTEFWIRESILKQNIRVSHNHHIDKPLYYLTIKLNKEGRGSAYTVPRLVYQAFGKHTKSLPAKFMTHKDDDNLNNHISNLQLASRTEIHTSSFSKNRRKSHFAGLTKKQRRTYTLKAVQANKKPVAQSNLRGKRIAAFDSILSATKATGIQDSSISSAINGRYQTAGGFIWKKR
jgi:NUMOD4 motif